MSCPPAEAPNGREDLSAGLRQENLLLCKKLDQAMLSMRLLEAAKDRYDALHDRAITNLAEALELNQRMVSAAPIGVAVYHAGSGRCEMANEAMASILGVDVPRVLAQGFWEFPSWRSGDILAAAERALASHLDQHLEGPVEAPSGKSIWISCVLTTFLSRSEDHLLVMINDQTERHHAELALLSSETKYRMLAEQLGEGLAVTDAELRFTYCNPWFARILGYKEEDLLGRDLLELAFEADQDAFRTKLLEHQETTASPWEFTVRQRNGAPMDVLVSITDLQDARNAFSGILVLLTDIRTHKQMDEARRYAQKMESLALMAGSIAHDFNNAFQVILNCLELIQGGNLDPGSLGSITARALAGLERAQELSRKMLDYSGRGFRRTVSLEVGKLLVEHQGLFESLAGTRVLIQAGHWKGSSRMLGDPDQLVQAVSNLVINAGESLTRDPSPVQLSLDLAETGLSQGQEGFWVLPPPPGPAMVLTISDRGCGIRPEDLRKIFDPFFTTKSTGRGLGLSATLGILKAHGAGLQVESRLSEGTVFRAVLPLADEAGETKIPGLELPVVQAGVRSILLADDDDTIRDMCAEILRDILGYRVLTAKDGVEAVDVFRRSPDEIALILMDATMPRLGGGEAFEEIKRIRPGAKAVLCSGFSETMGGEAIRDHGFLTFLKKPYSIKELEAALEKALGSP